MNLCMWYAIVMNSAFALLPRLVIRAPTCFVLGCMTAIAITCHCSRSFSDQANRGHSPLPLFSEHGCDRGAAAHRPTVGACEARGHMPGDPPRRPARSPRVPVRADGQRTRPFALPAAFPGGASPRTTTGPCRRCAWNMSRSTRATRRFAVGCCSRCLRARRSQQR